VPAYDLDTSALVKRSIAEAGSARGRQATDPASGNALDTSRLTAVELTAAVRRAWGTDLPSTDLQATLAAFRGDWSATNRTVAETVVLIDRAVVPAEQDAIRGDDALYLAAALAVRDIAIAQGQPALTIVSADREPTAAAMTPAG
jgi:hypothetical protein